MVLDLFTADSLIKCGLLLILCTLTMAAGYASGHRDGTREGFTRGRRYNAVARTTVTKFTDKVGSR